jgi:putative restriction endonuclease
LHHAAFDSHFLGIRPDYIVVVRRAILDEEDGPMLLHGLKDMNNRRMVLPTRHDLEPDKSLLEMRFQEFKRVS